MKSGRSVNSLLCSSSEFFTGDDRKFDAPSEIFGNHDTLHYPANSFKAITRRQIELEPASNINRDKGHNIPEALSAANFCWRWATVGLESGHFAPDPHGDQIKTHSPPSLRSASCTKWLHANKFVVFRARFKDYRGRQWRGIPWFDRFPTSSTSVRPIRWWCHFEEVEQPEIR